MRSIQFGNSVASIGGLDGPSLLKLCDPDGANGDPGILRPFQHDGKCYVSIFNKLKGKRETHRVPYNAATLPHEVWLEIDQAVSRTAQSELRAVKDLKSAGLTRVIPNGFSVMALMEQKANRIGTAVVGMDPQAGFVSDRQVVTTSLLPLPCIWSGFSFGAREMAVSKRGGMPLDIVGAEDAMRSCALMAEKMLIGNSDYDQYQDVANAKIYGYTDFTSRNTFSITAPSTSGWAGSTLIGELLGARQTLINEYQKKPYVIYLSPAWAQYLDDDYYRAADAGNKTIRQRVLDIDGFTELRELDELTGWDILIVAMKSNVVREVVGMDWTVVQWEELGGQKLSWMVLGIYVPQLRADYDGNCGINHGSVAP